MDAETVARVRCFNRTVTERVGALDESYLDRGRPRGETRLLWESGRDGGEARELRRRLDLDAGYASRLLRSLESQRLVVVEHGSADRRVRRARLTADGRAERAELDRLSDGLAASMLEPLEQPQRARLVAAMDEVERLMRASLVTITVTEPAGADTVRLETNRSLTEAIALYRKDGYREVEAFNSEAYAHHWFEKRL